MKLNSYGIEKFINLSKEKKIICWGAGTIPQLSDEIFLKLGILDNILCFSDNDLKKKNSNIKLMHRKIPIVSLNELLMMDMNDKIILITCENFIPVVRQLNEFKKFEKVECYSYVYLNYEYYTKNIKNKFKKEIQTKEYIKIPKIIHYFWFGGGIIPEFQRKCIESWKLHCPEYEFMQWNENNYDISRIRYVKQAYESKKWAFATDYARLDILYKYGGVYFDTDVELIRNIDELLFNDAFCIFGEWPAINSGSGMGTIKNNNIIAEMRDEPRSKIEFIYGDGTFDLTPNVIYESEVLKKYGLKKDFSLQEISGMKVYPTEIIAPASVLGDDVFVTENTYGIHYCRGSWLEEKNILGRKMSKSGELGI